MNEPYEWLSHDKVGRVLQLGCGARPMRDAINHDRWPHSAWVDVAHDLDVMPWPKALHQDFVAVYALDLVEHIRDVYGFMNEAWECLAPWGLLEIRVAAWDNPASYADCTHLHYFSGDSLRFFDCGDILWMVYGSIYLDSLGRQTRPWTLELWERTNHDHRWPERGDWLFRLRKVPADSPAVRRG